MKKFFASLLILLYFTATTGATVHMHYCMGELQSWQLWHAKKLNRKCSVCGMTKKKGCCEDRHVVIKVEKKHPLPVTTVLTLKPVAQPPSAYIDVSRPLLLQQGKLCCSSNSPPVPGTIPLFLRNCTLLI